MGWDAAKKLELIAALDDAYDHDSFGVLLQLRFGKSVEDVVGNKGFEIQLPEIVSLFERKGDLSRLAIVAAGDRSDDPALERLARYALDLDRMKDVDGLNLWLGAGPWLNRDTLVGALTRLTQPGHETSEVVAVRGAPRTGRTYTIELLRHLARRNPAGTRARFVHVDLEIVAQDGDLAEIQAFHLAEAIASQMHADLVKYVRESKPDEFKLAGFANEFHRVVQDMDRRLIIIVDSFRRVAVARSAVTLLGRIAEKLSYQNGECHLLLLDYQEEIPVGPTGYVETQLRDFTEDDLLLYFQQFYTQYLPSIRPGFAADDQRIAGSVDAVCRVGALTAQPNVEATGKAVLSECRRVLAQPDGP